MMTAPPHPDSVRQEQPLVPGQGAAAKPRTRVVVIDDHRTLGDLFAVALSYQDDVMLVGQATSATQGLALVAQLQPDVVVMDHRLPDIDGVTATARLLADHPMIKVVMLTASSDPQLITRAAAVGASAFVPKSGGLDELLAAIRNARRGAMVVDASLLASLAERTPRGPANVPVPVLTAREQEVLELLGAGLDARNASRRLGISLHTCRGHVKNLLAKLGCHSQLEAVVLATRLGLLRATIEE